MFVRTFTNKVQMKCQQYVSSFGEMIKELHQSLNALGSKNKDNRYCRISAAFKFIDLVK